MRCPICKKPADPAYRPFCSDRCANVDLGRWLTEGYAIEAPFDPDEEPSPPPRDTRAGVPGKLH